MNKAYSRIVWQNQPSTATALGATNLNRMDNALNTIDDRVVAMDTTKANQDTVNNVVQSITYNENNGVLTITKVNGAVANIDTKLEKLAVNFEYDPVTQQLVITLDDGTKQYVDMSSLITEYEFSDSDTIAFSINAGKVSASVKSGSITADKLQPNYLADVTVQAQNAYNSAEQAVEYADLSKRYAVGGIVPEDAEDNAKYYMEQARIARDEAEDISNVGIATETKLGLVKGNGNVKVEVDGNMNVDLSSKLDKTGDSSSTTVEFTQATSDSELITGSKLSILFGLVKKKFADILVSLGNKIDKSSIANNLVTTESGMVLDARQGKALKGLIDEQNNKLTWKQAINYSEAYAYSTSDIMLCSNSSFEGETIAIILIIPKILITATPKLFTKHLQISATSDYYIQTQLTTTSELLTTQWVNWVQVSGATFSWYYK